MPRGHAQLINCERTRLKRLLLREQSFMWPRNHAPYAAAKQMGIKIMTEKVDGAGYRVSRLDCKHFWSIPALGWQECLWCGKRRKIK